MKPNLEKNPLARHAIEFSIMIVKYVEALQKEGKYVIVKQLLRSATSIGASIMEAQTAESKADFVHKLKIADKEAHETWYWLYLCEQTGDKNFNDNFTTKLDEIMRLLNAIILSAKNSAKINQASKNENG